MTGPNQEGSFTDHPNENTTLLKPHNEEVNAQKDGKSPESFRDLKGHVKPILASLFISLVAGLNDGSLGAIIPRMKQYYNIPNETISLLFLCSALGFFSSASINGYIVHRLGQLRTLYLGAGMMLFSYSFLMFGFPFPLMCGFIVFTGAGMALLAAAMNVYIANIPLATVMLNILHSVYGIGAMLSPLVATILLQHDISWKGMYVFMALGALVNIICVTVGYYHVDFEAVAEEVVASEEDEGAQLLSNGPGVNDSIKETHAELTRAAIFNRMTIVGAAYILIYVGVEVTMGGWGYTFLTEGRHGDEVSMGRVVSGYWAALAAGRIVLGYMSGRYGEKFMITLFTMAIIGGLVLMMVSADAVVNSTVFIINGFLLGPMFPTTIALASRVLARKYHATSIGFMSALGAGGAALFPFLTGQIAGGFGILVLPLAAIAMSTMMMVLWIYVPSDKPFFAACKQDRYSRI
ncbi:MFS general substrate transporter [Basidiobolus meristosporus CBS 931.73]|uniref:MFS general substrate transporter n=1 Tax=Basidiobolus meristosporus CBS 931.73 TaxID=1314790 RepID=A0A1Y1YQ63_9FUNG|nr:MFS general substrate transporter [Basidiobolus meristosporus CBS 931.73]|eukprot:ORY00106.1 MFS general substrate transporter [Basidiobolus meristosporus CBS 931.73]